MAHGDQHRGIDVDGSLDRLADPFVHQETLLQIQDENRPATDAARARHRVMELGIYTFGELTDPALTARERLRTCSRRSSWPTRSGSTCSASASTTGPTSRSRRPPSCSAAAAARTQRIRLTSAVTVLSSDDPVRVFQDFATLDLLSGGRAEIMAGRGSFIESFPLFGYDLDDYDELFAEKLDLLLRAARRRARDLVGPPPAARSTELGVYPRPVQEPLPVWVAVGGNAAVGRARRRARPADGARDHRRRSRRASRRSPSCTAARPREAGHDRGRRSSINSHGFIADDVAGRRRRVAYPAHKA